MIEINQIQSVADGLATQPVGSLINDFSSAVSGLGYVSDPTILELINQIYALFGELSKLTS